jgi:DNA-binding transcriptional LysR family regulator
MTSDIEFSISTNEAKVVCVIKETKNMALAAEELNIPRTTLMSMLGRLEKKLGSLIFQRKQGSGEVSITEYGESVIPKLEKIAWLGESVRTRTVLWGNKHNEGEVSFITTQTLFDSFFIRHLKKFLDQNPGIRLTLFPKTQYFDQKDINGIFIGQWEDDSESYEYFPFYSFKQKLWASEEYLEKHGKITEVNDLVRHRFIVLQNPDTKKNIFGNDLALRTLARSARELNVVYSGDPRTMDRLSELGGGIISSSEETIKLGGFNVTRILPEIEGESVEIFVRVDRKFLESEVAKFFIDWVFACRDEALTRIGMTNFPEHKPLSKYPAKL